MVTRRVYKRPPITEATCELSFGSNPSWDLAAAAAVHAALRGEYPAPATALTRQGVELVEADSPTFRVRNEDPRHEIANENRSRLVRFGGQGVSIHVLGAYSGWEDFRRRIGDALAAFANAVPDARPTRAGIRYVNEVQFPAAEVALDDYFVGLPGAPGDMGLSISSFLIRTETTREDGTKLTYTFANAPAAENGAAVLLDLDATRPLDENGAWTWEELMAEVDDLRAFERDAFESFITDEAREMFDAS
jgi:uncharacterized protein (TIGR04255 family)